MITSSRTRMGDGLTHARRAKLAVSKMPEPRRWKKAESTEARHDDEIAESIKVTMRALNDFFGSRVASKEGRLRAVGSEFGHIVAKNITRSDNPVVLLDEIASFWNSNGLGEMEIVKGQPLTFTVRNCFDCMGAQAGEPLCSFKEGFINAILSERTGGIGMVDEVECCGSGAAACKFKVVPFHRVPG